MQAQGTICNTGSPSGDRSVDQLATRERQVGATGMAQRFALLMKLGNSGGGKGPQLKADAKLLILKGRNEVMQQLLVSYRELSMHGGNGAFAQLRECLLGIRKSDEEVDR